MDNSRKSNEKQDGTKGLKLAKLVLDSLKDIDNGSVTFIKQDDHLIQVNRNSRIFVGC